MATFPSIKPTYGVQKRSAPRVRSIQFGSGYQQRAQFGIQQNPKSYDLTFEVSQSQADAIEEFLDARAAVEHFNFIPPGEAESSKFICRQWSKSIPYLNRATVTATFEQVFEKS